MKAIQIQWDASEEERATLPTEIEIPENIESDDEDAISDYLSDTTGYCHFGYCIEQ